MDKEEKILDLKVKIVDLKLQRETETLRLGAGIVVGVFAFFKVLDYLNDYFNTSIKNLVGLTAKLPPPFVYIILLLVVVIVPLIAGFLGIRITNLIFKIQGKVYDDRISEIEKLIQSIEK